MAKIQDLPVEVLQLIFSHFSVVGILNQTIWIPWQGYVKSNGTFEDPWTIPRLLNMGHATGGMFFEPHVSRLLKPDFTILNVMRTCINWRNLIVQNIYDIDWTSLKTWDDEDFTDATGMLLRIEKLCIEGTLRRARYKATQDRKIQAARARAAGRRAKERRRIRLRDLRNRVLIGS